MTATAIAAYACRSAVSKTMDCCDWGILADAVKGKRLAVNPARGIENLPRKTAKRRVYLSAEDVARLADESGA
jgi:hypothetical protein